MKITGTRSYIIVELWGKELKIQGELTLTPAFYASKSSIKNWEVPFHEVEISEIEKAEIIQEIELHNNPEFKIIFED